MPLSQDAGQVDGLFVPVDAIHVPVDAIRSLVSRGLSNPGDVASSYDDIECLAFIEFDPATGQPTESMAPLASLALNPAKTAAAYDMIEPVEKVVASSVSRATSRDRPRHV